MSDNFNLVIKNGSCYIDGKLIKIDLGLSGNKIKKIGKRILKKTINEIDNLIINEFKKT